MACEYNRPECSCGSKVNATCVDYEGIIPSCSKYAGQNGITLEQLLEEFMQKVCDLEAQKAQAQAVDYCPPENR